MEQRRILLALAISLIVVTVYQQLVARLYPHPARTTFERPHVEAPPTAPPTAPPPPVAAEPETTGESAESVAVETDRLRVVVSSRGARLQAFELKDYRQTVESSLPLDLVQVASVLPITLDFGNGTTDAKLPYRFEPDGLALHGDEEGVLSFEAELPGGGRVEKRYEFSGDGYLFHVRITVSGIAQQHTLSLVLTPLAPENPADKTAQTAVALSSHALVQKTVADLQKQPATTLDEVRWAGFAEHYFLFAILPEEGTARATLSSAEGLPLIHLYSAGGDEGRFTFFAGPKDRDVLAQAGHELSRALDFGWFWFIAIPLLKGLELLYRMTGNYGIAIIILTALVKLATTPLTQSTFRNMREMQKIQPQISKLRERFKEDQAALQKEMMELYRRHHVNPLSGCLPLLLQFPIFLGLYNALGHAIELRHAAFALWISDLSVPDRLMVAGVGVPVLVLLMGASQFVQQWIMPQQGDPTQQRMMMFMPVVFTFMFLNMPAGLVLYWLVNNILSIIQQFWMLRSGGARSDR